MGKTVNVTLWDGKVVSVPEADAARLTAARTAVPLTGGENAKLVEARDNADSSSGIVEGLKAAGEGALDTATLGGYGKLREAVDPEGARDSQVRAQERPGMRLAGEVATMFAPTGALGDVAKGASEITGLGLASRTGAALGGSAGRLAEGAILGAGSHIASTNVTGDSLTIAGTAEAAGIGGLLNVGIGLAADKLTGAGTRAIASREAQGAAESQATKAADQLKQDHLFAEQGEKTFAKDSPVSDRYREFYDAQTTAQKAEVSQWKDTEKANDKLDDFLDSTEDFGKLRAKFAKAQNEIRSKYVQRGMAGDVAHMEATGISFEDMVKQKEMAGAFLSETDKQLNEAAKLWRGGSKVEAVQALQTVRSQLGQTFVDISVPDIIDVPIPRYPEPVQVEVPRDLPGFQRMHKETIANLANQLDPEAAGLFGKVAEEAGWKQGASPGETLDAVHSKLGEYASTMNKLETAAAEQRANAAVKRAMGGEETGNKAPITAWLQRFTRNAAVNTAGMVAFHGLGGGIPGVIAAAAGRQVAQSAATAVEDGLLGSALVAAKEGVRTKVRDVIANYGIPSARKLSALGPVTAYLAAKIPGGERDPERDQRKQAANRAEELRQLQRLTPDAMFLTIEGMLGHPADIGPKLHAFVMNAVNYLTMTAPKDTGTDTTMWSSKWTPAWHESVAFAHRIEAVMDPFKAIARAISGGGHQAATEALHTVWGDVMSETANEVALNAPTLKGLTYEQGGAYSTLFGVKLTGLQEPVVITAIQGLYIQAGAAPQPSPGNPRRGSKPPGRPAAVQSPLAGSSPTALTA